MNASKTAQYVALYRALETVEPRRAPLFQDPLATCFLTPPLAAAVRASRFAALRTVLEWIADRKAPGARSSAIGRTRYIDDAVSRAVDDGARQAVILGAGYDCRAHRLSSLRGVRVFEVDRAATQVDKRRRVAAHGALADVAYVSVDFAVDDVAARLRDAGFDPAIPTVFWWEGVTNYLDATAVAEVLGWIGHAAPGSTLVFTYIHRDVFDAPHRFPGAREMVARVSALGEPWKFGIDPREIAAYLAGFGLALVEDLGADTYRARYLDPGSPGIDGYAFYRLAVARVASAR